MNLSIRILVGLLLGVVQASAYSSDALSPLPARLTEAVDDLLSTDAEQEAFITSVVSRHTFEPIWSVQAGAAILTRGTLSGSQVIQGLLDGGIRENTLNASQFRFNHAAGPDIAAVRRLKKGRYFDSLNFRFFDVQSVSANQSLQFVRRPAYIGYRFPTMDPNEFFNTNSFQPQNSTYATSLYSFEANASKQIGTAGIQWLTGFRWIQLNDSLAVNATSVSPSSADRDTWGTNNSLYGWQVGALIPVIDASQRLSLTCTPKIGIYGNQCGSTWNSVYEGQNRPGLSNFRNQVAFAGDLSVMAKYRITKSWSLLGGYQILWLNGVGVAGDQPEVTGYFDPRPLTPQTVNGLNSSGSAFFHGALVGVNCQW